MALVVEALNGEAERRNAVAKRLLKQPDPEFSNDQLVELLRSSIFMENLAAVLTLPVGPTTLEEVSAPAEPESDKPRRGRPPKVKEPELVALDSAHIGGTVRATDPQGKVFPVVVEEAVKVGDTLEKSKVADRWHARAVPSRRGRRPRLAKPAQ